MNANPHVCDVCGKEIASGIRELRRHQKFAHTRSSSLNKLPNIKCKEPGCTFWCYKLKAFRSHLESDHGLSQDVEELWFRDVREFELWKSSEENQTASKWVRIGGVPDKHSTLHYYCHRTGKMRLSTRPRNSKQRGSCKLDNYCTSTISFSQRPQGVLVHYYKKHYGHDSYCDNQPVQTRLSEDVKDVIALELMKGKSVSEVFSALKQNNIVEVTRSHVHGIAKEYGLKHSTVSKSSLASKLCSIKQSHLIAANACNMLVLRLPDEWKIKCFEEIFTVKQRESQDGHGLCKERCPRCLMCVHTFSCTCASYLTEQNMCEHIHKVCMTFPQADECDSEESKTDIREEVRKCALSILNFCDQVEDSKTAIWNKVYELLKQANDFLTEEKVLNAHCDHSNIVADNNLVLIGPTASNTKGEHSSSYSLVAVSSGIQYCAIAPKTEEDTVGQIEGGQLLLTELESTKEVDEKVRVVFSNKLLLES